MERKLILLNIQSYTKAIQEKLEHLEQHGETEWTCQYDGIVLTTTELIERYADTILSYMGGL